MKLLLCVVFAQITLGLLMAEHERRATATPRSGRQTDLWNPEKPQKLFARGGLKEYKRTQETKMLGNPIVKAPGCSRLEESCAPESHLRCCDPCASCHCRFFNTICRCWRLGRPCHT